MELDFNKEIERIIKEKKEKSPNELYEVHRIRKKEDEFVTMELRKNGFKVSSVYDLVNYKQTDFDYIPILLQILKSDKISDDIIKDGIIRALTVKKAKGQVEDYLLREFQNLTENQTATLGWTIGNLFEYLYSDKYFGQIVEIVQNKKHGTARQMFVSGLTKTKKHKEEVENRLIDLSYDRDVALHAVGGMGKLKSVKAKKRLTELLTDKNKTLSKKAKSVLEKIEKYE